MRALRTRGGIGTEYWLTAVRSRSAANGRIPALTCRLIDRRAGVGFTQCRRKGVGRIGIAVASRKFSRKDVATALSTGLPRRNTQETGLVSGDPQGRCRHPPHRYAPNEGGHRHSQAKTHVDHARQRLTLAGRSAPPGLLVRCVCPPHNEKRPLPHGKRSEAVAATRFELVTKGGIGLLIP